MVRDLAMQLTCDDRRQMFDGLPHALHDRVRIAPGDDEAGPCQVGVALLLDEVRPNRDEDRTLPNCGTPNFDVHTTLVPVT